MCVNFPKNYLEFKIKKKRKLISQSNLRKKVLFLNTWPLFSSYSRSFFRLISGSSLQLFRVYIREKRRLCRGLLQSEPCAFFMELFHFKSAVFRLLLLALPLFFDLFSVRFRALGQCFQAESSSLLQLKRGFTSGKLKTWRQETDCCIWEGVTCDEARRVTGLDLSSRSISGKIDVSLFNLTSLRALNFADNQFDQIPIPASGWDKLANLSSINFSNAGFAGKVPAGFSRLTKLNFLDLSYHGDFEMLYLTSKPSFLPNMSSLKELYLDFVNLSAYSDEWSDAVVNSTPILEVLSMTGCSLFGFFPKQIFQLRKLKYFYVTFNPMLYGSLPDFPEDSCLESLMLSYTNFSGNIPDTIGNLKSLTSLYLSNCQISGRIPPSMGNLSQLVALDLSNNKLHEQVPRSLFQLSGLVSLSLASNNFSGVVELEFMKDLTNLVWLDLSNSGLSLNPWDADDGSLLAFFSNLLSLRLSNCNLTKIPAFIKYQHYMYNLDLSNNRLIGEIPTWLWSIRKQDQYLEKNGFISLANNKLDGEISPFICNLTGVMLLDLSMNELTGSIPQCLFEEGINLYFLNLNGNKLHGTIPNEISPKCKLQAIILRDNRLEGLLPKSLSNCRSLEILDMGNNNLMDTFPFWLGNMSSLRILVLRSNNFYGLVRLENHVENFKFSMLDVFDISSNNFSGKLRKECFSNLKSMMINGENTFHSFACYIKGYRHYLDTPTIMNKEKLMKLQNYCKIFKSIDFSNNHFGGEIPSTLGQLVSLQKLNMSHNNLIGKIPPQLGNLSLLQSLDISMNNLSGRIPHELILLHFLSYLNLSFNKLVGEIPLEGPFSTFPNSSFEGNEGLCWFPCNTSLIHF